jgi:superoxide dismutase, Fe-Mn family
MMTRRQALKTTALATTAIAASPSFAQAPTPATAAQPGPFTLPALPYAFDALEPHIDARTMEIHHDRHHGAYVSNLNKAIFELTELRREPIDALMANLDRVPENVRTAVRNNGGGHYNHSLFWQMMKKNGGGEPKGELAKAIESNFGNFADFKSKFGDAATKVFGSGWAWLVVTQGKLAVVSTPNQDTPRAQNAQPLLGLDVWEHAYYLKFQNKRADYIGAWWNVVNWDFVAEQYAKFKS